VLYEANARIQREITENTADTQAEQRFLTFVEQILPQVRVADHALRDKLLGAAGYSPSPETQEMVRRFRAEVSIFREENVPLLSELAVLENEYGKITGALTIDWDGETETLPRARQRQRSLDRSERERAWRLEMAAYADVREQLNNLYLKMLPLRRQLARNAVLTNYRAFRWLEFCRFDYTPQDCHTFHDAIEHGFVPLASKITAELGAMLGLDSVRPWDIEVDLTGAAHAIRRCGGIGGRSPAHLRTGRPGAGRLLRRHAGRFPGPGFAAKQSTGRLLRELSRDRQTVHLHERRRNAR
jgi:oligoendopeptidase F